MNYKKKWKQRLYLAIGCIVFGLALINADLCNGFEKDFFCSFGVALVVMAY